MKHLRNYNILFGKFTIFSKIFFIHMYNLKKPINLEITSTNFNYMYKKISRTAGHNSVGSTIKCFKSIFARVDFLCTKKVFLERPPNHF